MKIEYTPKKFKPQTLRVIAQAEIICQDYAAQGFDLTVRQLYYQFVARGLIPNNQKEYTNLKDIVNDARMAGLLDWNHIVDRTRNLRSLSHWDSPADMVLGASQQFRTDKWARQPSRVEVWIEKDALVGVLETACEPLDVPYFSCRGYTSASEIWRAAQRLNRYRWAGQNVIILHLGDHDPSGIDMTRDIQDRLRLITGKDGTNHLRDLLREEIKAGRIDADAEDYKEKATTWLNSVVDDWGDIQVRRIALTMDQVEEYQPPPNPAKTTDARSGQRQDGSIRPGSYIDEFGHESWELDALDPATLTALIQDEITAFRDDDLWDADIEEEESNSERLARIGEQWDDINTWLDEQAS